MIALWSFWSKPALNNNHSAWLQPRYHLLSWILSVETAGKHFPETALVTDDDGARLLVDSLGLSFTTVSTALNSLDLHDVNWWALGKLCAYRQQKDPFLHIDSDAYLWNGLPHHFKHSPLIAQNPEHFEAGNSWYHPEKFDEIKSNGGWVPEEVDWFRSLGINQKAECCGIFGGCNTDFIEYYAAGAIRLIEEPANNRIWSVMGADNILIEQYYLSACLEFHRSRQERRFGDIDISYLFNSSEEAFNPEFARSAGYTHLIGGAKKNENLMKRLERRVERDCPDLYYRAMNYLRSLQ